MAVFVFIKIWILNKQPVQGPNPQKPNQPVTTSASTPGKTQGTKIYRNTEFGFGFEYPTNWTFEENSFYSGSSKFNLQGNTSDKNYNPILPFFLINIVTIDFAETSAINKQNLGAIKSDIIVGGVQGIKYEYTENYPKISIDLSIGEYRMLLAVRKQHEDVFNQILASFKFLK